MNRKKIIAGILILLLLLAMAACGDSGSRNKIVAKVGDREISESQLNQFMHFYGFMQGMDLENIGEDGLAYVRNLILEEYININLLLNEYDEKGVELTEEAFAEAADFVKQVAGQDAAAAYMKKNKISDDFIKELYLNQYYTKMYYDEIALEIPKVSEDEARAYYNENLDYFIVDEVEARHILIDLADKDLAEELLAKVQAGEDFAELAKEYSICPSSEEGGYLGTFGRGEMVQEFETAAFALKTGELSGLVESSFGWHIIEAIKRVDEIQAFEKVEASIMEFLEGTKIMDEFNVRILALREKYEIEYIGD